ncbi:hypothetical protein EDC14_104218 [Hydrogenispora ethanolica]|uniref:Uncharacterized protein n=1 Tax=Hydrogenispora ethanolica TaxID=1082276 RepID=A0A4R1QZA6_HYDET|nr:hypothetical protein [Hydrogenispora ethanolica]TCL58325.1 hypothetical protein EDC14_104218 [Hydrogenispora ethanolica]
MIEDIINIHDKYQFEIKWSYRLQRQRRFSTYRIETYFFIPQSLGLNRNTYAKQDFYNDIQSYIRFKTPTVLLKNIAEGPERPLAKLKAVFQRVADQPDPENLREYEQSIKLFGCIFRSSLRDHVTFIHKKRRVAEIQDLTEQFIQYATAAVRSYRELGSLLNVPTIREKDFAKYRFGDEYLSLMVEQYSFSLLNRLREKLGLQGQPYTQRLLGIIRDELEYRRLQGYPSIPEEEGENEGLVFRKSILKKYMGSILFLKIRTESEGKIVEQIVLGIAAGVAMIFATAIAFFSQQQYGNLSLPLFVALVIGYIFKDRLKELLRSYFHEQLHSFLYDHKIVLHTGDQLPLGWCKESVDYVSEAGVPGGIRRRRNRDHLTEIENDWLGESIIVYKKYIRLRAVKLENFHEPEPVESINDIMRFNIQKFLAKMDNPEKNIYVIAGDGYKKVAAQRVYHLNLVIRYSFDGQNSYKRFRIILNRRGIKSIEVLNVE